MTVPDLLPAVTGSLGVASADLMQPGIQPPSAGVPRHGVSVTRSGPYVLLAHGPYDKVLYLAQAALASCHFSVLSLDAQGGLITAKSGVSGKSWGEVIYVFFRSVQTGGTQISCSSKLKFGLYDWGKNRDNVERLFAALLAMSDGPAAAGLAVPPTYGTVVPQVPKRYAEDKNRWIALVLSLLIVGLGQFYNGDSKKGLMMLLVAIGSGVITCGVLWFAMAIWSAIDAFLVASKRSAMWQPL
jgi:TM2 domain-containing membrane protein YozV